MSDDAQAQACVEAAIEAFDTLDVLINNASVLLVGAETDKIPRDKLSMNTSAALCGRRS